MYKCICFILFGVLAFPLMALKAYEAKYAIYWYGFKAGYSVHKVKKLPNNNFEATVHSQPNLSFLPYSYYDKSKFQYNNHHLTKIKSLSHEFSYHQNNKNVKGYIEFDWKNNVVLNDVHSYLSNSTFDKVSHTFQLREDLKYGKENSFTYHIAKTDSVKKYSFYIIGHDKIKTSIGVLDTIKIQHLSKDNSRRTILWLASELDFLMVKLHQFRDNKLTGRIMIRRFKVFD